MQDNTTTGFEGPSAAAESTTTDEETETMANETIVDIKEFAYIPDGTIILAPSRRTARSLA